MSLDRVVDSLFEQKLNNVITCIHTFFQDSVIQLGEILRAWKGSGFSSFRVFEGFE